MRTTPTTLALRQRKRAIPRRGLAAQAKSFPTSSNVGTPMSPLSPKRSDIKLISHNFSKHGQSSERKRPLEKWDQDVGAQAK